MEQRKPADPHLLVWLQDQSGGGGGGRGGGGGVFMAHEEVIHDEVMSNSRSHTNSNLTKGMCQYIRAKFINVTQDRMAQ